MPRRDLTRRAFLKAGAAAGAAFCAPTIIPATALGLDGRAAPSERVVLSAIGTGGRGQQNLSAFLALPNVQVVGVADVDRKQAEIGAALVDKQYGNADCRRLGDFRELLANTDLNAVCVSTPDHWHALIAIAAANAGKDIYCETPLANSIGESRAVGDAIRRTGRIFQCGTQERSNPKVRYACELVRRGHLGELKTVRIQMPTDQSHHEHVRKALDMPRAEPVPDGLDYDFWLGHTPPAPYCSGRCHFWWRFILAYGGGELTDRGGHMIDLARLGAGRDSVDPMSVTATGTRNPSGLYDTFLTFDFTVTYEDGVQFIGESKGPRGLRFEGTSGTLFVGVPGGGCEAEPKGLLETKIEGFDPGQTGASHHRNFIDSVKSRQPTLANVESAQRTATICHLTNIAMTLGRELKWDSQAGQVTGDDQANAMLLPAMREPWTL
jgi:predicted dehydrogenase